MQRTEIKNIGEFGLIERLASKVKKYHPETLKGIGDDAAVMQVGEYCVVTTTDMLLEGVHFDLSYVPLKHLGYKAVVVNISDLAAMNAIPKQITVSVALSNRFSVEAVEEFYEGIRSACEMYQVDLVGGDTTSSRAGLVISVTALGIAKKDEIVYRNTAQKTDIICVTGDLGGAFMGLQVLEREKAVFVANSEMQPQLEGKDYVIKRQLKPEARTDVMYELREIGVQPTAMIDISDGLASELIHLCKKSNLGAFIFEDKLPISQETYDAALNDFKISPITCALNGGEDYELLFSIRQEDYEKIKNHSEISVIGYFAEPEKDVNLITRSEQTIKIQAQGWTHF